MGCASVMYCDLALILQGCIVAKLSPKHRCANSGTVKPDYCT